MVQKQRTSKPTKYTLEAERKVQIKINSISQVWRESLQN